MPLMRAVLANCSSATSRARGTTAAASIGTDRARIQIRSRTSGASKAIPASGATPASTSAAPTPMSIDSQNDSAARVVKRSVRWTSTCASPFWYSTLVKADTASARLTKPKSSGASRYASAICVVSVAALTATVCSMNHMPPDTDRRVSSESC